jgi:hypothetical protein
VDSSRKNSLPDCTANAASLHDLFVGVEPLASQLLLKWSKQLKITWGEMKNVRREGGVVPHILVHQGHLSTITCAECGQALSWTVMTPLDTCTHFWF